MPRIVKPSPRRPDLSARRLLGLGGLFVLFTGLGLGAVYGALGGIAPEFDPALISPRMIASVGALMLVYFVADGLRLYLTLRALGEVVPLRDMARLVFINIFFSNITPMATGGGVAQVWYLGRVGVGVGRALAATTIRTALAILVIFALAPVVLLLLPDMPGHALFGRISWGLMALVALYLAGFAILVLRTGWLVAGLARGVDLLARAGIVGSGRAARWQARLHDEMLDFAQAFRGYLNGRKRHVLGSILFTGVFLLSLFSFPALILANLGHEVSYFATTGKLVVVTFVMYFAPTPGAAGISEGVFASLFAAQVPAGQLVLVILAWRFVTIHFAMLVGLVLVQAEIARSGRRRR